MRGTAAILVCLISLHYLSVIDAYTAKFTSENGMPEREYQDKHPRKSNDVKRSLSASPEKTLRQEPDYNNWENYGGIPNIPGYQDRNEEEEEPTARRAEPFYRYDDMIDPEAETDKNGFSKTLKRLLNSVADAVRQLWGKLGGKSSESVGGESAGVDTKRDNVRSEPSKKRAMEWRNGEDSEATNPERGVIIDHLKYLAEMAKKGLDLARDAIAKIDVSKLSKETKKLKEAIMEILKKARDALGDLIDDVVRGAGSVDDQSPSMRRTRSVGKITNVRDALDSYLTSLRSQKRSKARNSLRRSTKRNNSAGESDMTALFNLMTEMEDCIKKMSADSTSRLGIKCIVSPLLKVLASPKRSDPNDLTMNPDSNVRSNKIESLDNMRRLNFPWGSVFLIPIYEGQPPGENTTTTTSTTTTTPSYPDQRVNDQGFDNVTTTTTTEPPTTTTSSTTEVLPTWPDLPVYEESDKAGRDDSRYRSKYDHDF